MSTDSTLVLNLGCGRKKLVGAVNLDITPDTNPDVVHNLNETPWPFPDNTFTKVRAIDVIEHLEDILKTMEEVHRICKPGAKVEIVVPHFSCANAFQDPTHRHFFSVFSFDYFTGAHEHDYYTRARYRPVQAQIVFQPTLLNKLIHRLAARWPKRYEMRWAWRFPAWLLSIVLEVEKS